MKTGLVDRHWLPIGLLVRPGQDPSTAGKTEKKNCQNSVCRPFLFKNSRLLVIFC